MSMALVEIFVGFARRQRTTKPWGTGSSGVGWMDRDRAARQGTQDSTSPREGQGRHRGSLLQTRRAETERDKVVQHTKLCHTPEGHQSGVVCVECRVPSYG